MVSKNNKYQKQIMTLDREVPHYSLRKLGIGVVSVLLGTTMYLGANSTVANAATVNGTSGSDSNTTQSGVAAKTNALQSASAVTMSTAQASTVPAVSSTAGSQTSQVSQANQASASQASQASQVSQPAVSQSASQANWQAVYQLNATPATSNKSAASANPVSAADTTNNITVTDAQGNVYKDGAILNPDKADTVNISVNTRNAKNGDVYKYTLTEKDDANLDFDGAPFQGGGVVDTDTDKGDDLYTITDTFHNDSTTNQPIALRFLGLKDEKLQSPHVIDQILSIYRNGNLVGQYHFLNDLEEKLGIQWNDKSVDDKNDDAIAPTWGDNGRIKAGFWGKNKKAYYVLPGINYSY